jgi:hypothetical protein
VVGPENQGPPQHCFSNPLKSRARTIVVVVGENMRSKSDVSDHKGDNSQESARSDYMSTV